MMELVKVVNCFQNCTLRDKSQHTPTQVAGMLDFMSENGIEKQAVVFGSGQRGIGNLNSQAAGWAYNFSKVPNFGKVFSHQKSSNCWGGFSLTTSLTP